MSACGNSISVLQDTAVSPNNVHGRNLVVTRHVPCRIDVALKEVDVRILLGQCFKHRGNLVAWSAPAYVEALSEACNRYILVGTHHVAWKSITESLSLDFSRMPLSWEREVMCVIDMVVSSCVGCPQARKRDGLEEAPIRHEHHVARVNEPNTTKRVRLPTSSRDARRLA